MGEPRTEHRIRLTRTQAEAIDREWDAATRSLHGVAHTYANAIKWLQSRDVSLPTEDSAVNIDVVARRFGATWTSTGISLRETSKWFMQMWVDDLAAVVMHELILAARERRPRPHWKVDAALGQVAAKLATYMVGGDPITALGDIA